MLYKIIWRYVMSNVTVIATIQVKSDAIDFLKNQLCKLVCPTRCECGCILYEFYQDCNDPTFFHSYEKWCSMESVKQHLKSKHIQEYLEATEDVVTNFEIRYFNRIC